MVLLPTLPAVLITPYIGVIIGAIFHFFSLLARVFVSEEISPSKTWLRLIFRFFGSIFEGLYGILGLLCVYISIAWIAGTLGYADLLYQLPSVILSLIVGLEYCWNVWLKKGARSLLLLMILGILGLLYLFIIYIPSLDVISDGAARTGYVIGGVIVLYILWSMGDEIFGDKVKKSPLWNGDRFSKKFLTWTFDLVLWILLVTEFLFKLIGSSLLQYWIL
jgi:hypothetical protein